MWLFGRRRVCLSLWWCLCPKWVRRGMPPPPRSIITIKLCLCMILCPPCAIDSEMRPFRGGVCPVLPWQNFSGPMPRKRSASRRQTSQNVEKIATHHSSFPTYLLTILLFLHIYQPSFFSYISIIIPYPPSTNASKCISSWQNGTDDFEDHRNGDRLRFGTKND